MALRRAAAKQLDICTERMPCEAVELRYALALNLLASIKVAAGPANFNNFVLHRDLSTATWKKSHPFV